jgi:pimeloyl-ACP methyl ester carboxylesterase
MTTKAELVPVAGGQLRVRVGGDGVPVLFVHPALMNGHVWDDVLDSLDRADAITAVLPDLPLGAHGAPIEPDADLSLPALARMLVSVLDHLGVEQVVVVGNDTGGAIAQQFVADHPDRVAGVLLLSCDAFENFPPRAFRWFPKALQLPGAPWLVAQVMRAARCAACRSPSAASSTADSTTPRPSASWVRCGDRARTVTTSDVRRRP